MSASRNDLQQAIGLTAPPKLLDNQWLDFFDPSEVLRYEKVSSNKSSLAATHEAFNKFCKENNVKALEGTLSYLSEGIQVNDSQIQGKDQYEIPIRTYTPAPDTTSGTVVIYYPGGGLRIGDLESEDLSCRRICKDLSATVISVDYRVTLDDPTRIEYAIVDSYDVFERYANDESTKELYLVGSSSGGMLAALVSQLARDSETPLKKSIDGVQLRCPVTINPECVPERFREYYVSNSEEFNTVLVQLRDGRHWPKKLPLAAETFANLPPADIFCCRHDIYWSDAVCYAKGLQDDGVCVIFHQLEFSPHTYWLLFPENANSIKVEEEMIEGLKWLRQL
jgi:acetyl esterase/lipase